MKLGLVISLLIVFILGVGQAQKGQKGALVYSLNDPPKEISQILNEEHEVMLNFYNGDMDKAMQDWYDLLTSLEDYAETESVDLKGVKVWLNVFFRPDGTMKAVGYYPKNESKKIDWPLFEALLQEFSKQYQFPVQLEQPFSHYAAAMWPIEMLSR